MNRDAAKEFVERLEWIHEVEPGDFRRKLGLYLNRLEQRTPQEQRTLEFRKTLALIRDKYIYCPQTEDLHQIREEVVELAQNLLH